jgi:hypothetical protein
VLYGPQGYLCCAVHKGSSVVLSPRVLVYMVPKVFCIEC